MRPEIRDFEAGDAPALLALMRSLARFEDYEADLRVTQASLLENGLGPDAIFKALVAPEAHGGGLLGMAVTYVVPWTYTLRPRLVLKELFVTEQARGLGVGHALMDRVAEQGREIGADHVAWTVMSGNEKAERFYTGLGGRPDPKWQNWVLRLD